MADKEIDAALKAQREAEAERIAQAEAKNAPRAVDPQRAISAKHAAREKVQRAAEERRRAREAALARQAADQAPRRRRYRVTGVTGVFGVEPGDKFTRAIDPAQEARLLDSGAIQRVGGRPAPADPEAPKASDSTRLRADGPSKNKE